MKADLVVDLSGLRCPLPVLRTKKALTQIKSGELLCVYATDADSEQDIPAFVRQAGHALEQCRKEDGRWCFYIRRR